MNFFISAKKRDLLQESKLTKEIENIILPFGYKIESFRYYPNIFGNIVVTIKKNNIVDSFVTDRGEIYHNNHLLKIAENTDDLQKSLFKIIGEVVSGKG